MHEETVARRVGEGRHTSETQCERAGSDGPCAVMRKSCRTSRLRDHGRAIAREIRPRLRSAQGFRGRSAGEPAHHASCGFCGPEGSGACAENGGCLLGLRLAKEHPRCTAAGTVTQARHATIFTAQCDSPVLAAEARAITLLVRDGSGTNRGKKHAPVSGRAKLTCRYGTLHFHLEPIPDAARAAGRDHRPCAAAPLWRTSVRRLRLGDQDAPSDASREAAGADDRIAGDRTESRNVWGPLDEPPFFKPFAQTSART